jgi:hypothetical protein
MRVLLLETNPSAADTVAASLSAKGHDVLRCHEIGDAAWPCNGLRDGRCPLDACAVDVAVTVRSRPVPRPTPTEDGVTCALRHGVPVVVAGRTVLQPFAPWSSAVVEGQDPDEVMAACEQAAHGPLPQLSRAAGVELERLLGLHAANPPAGDERSGAHAEVSRGEHGAVRVEIHVPPEAPDAVVHTAAVRLAGLVRKHDPRARAVSVVRRRP